MSNDQSNQKQPEQQPKQTPTPIGDRFAQDEAPKKQ